MATSPQPGTIPPGQEGPSQEPQASPPPAIPQNPGQIPPPSFPANRQQFGQQNPSRWRSFKRNPCCCMELGQGALIASICLILHQPIATILYILNLLHVIRLPNMDADTNIAKIFTIVGISMSVIFLGFAIIMTYGVIKKSVPILMISVYGCCGASLVLNVINTVSVNSGSIKKDLGPTLGLFAAILVHAFVLIYLLFVVETYYKLLRAEGLMKAMGGGGYGQFPVGPPPPNGQQLYYQPSVPTVGYSQTSLSPGGQQQPQQPGSPTQQ